MAFNDYASLFSGTGGLLNTLSNPDSMIRFTTSAAESAAWAIYQNNYNLIKTKDRTVPTALNMLMGSNVASDLMAGGYQPHIGAYLAHQVGMATFTVLNKIKNILSPGQFDTLRLRSEELLNQPNEPGINDDFIKQILSTFATVSDLTPKKFYEVFFKQFQSAYLTGDRFLCLFEKEVDTSGYNQIDTDNRNTNRHYQAFLVKNVTIPSTDIENVEFKRFGQNFSIMGNLGTNENVMVNYYVDRHNVLYNKLYQHITNDNFKSPEDYYTMYIIINNPYQDVGYDGMSDLITKNITAMKMNLNSQLPTIDKKSVISVWKYKGVHVKNINQVTYDNGSPDFLNLPVTFSHNGLEVTHYSDDVFNQYNINSFIKEERHKIY